MYIGDKLGRPNKNNENSGNEADTKTYKGNISVVADPLSKKMTRIYISGNVKHHSSMWHTKYWHKTLRFD